jgi:hypothetical protein
MQKCELCENTNTEHVKVIYSVSPFGEDSDSVHLCEHHLTDAQNRYEVITLK